MNKIVLFNKDKIADDDYLWKYVSIEKFFSIVLNKQLHFSRIDCFDDIYEGIVPALLLLKNEKSTFIKRNSFISDYGISVDYNPAEMDSLYDIWNKVKISNFSNCLYKSSENLESVAMWRLYSMPNSVAMKIRFVDFYERLQNSGFTSSYQIDKLIMGPVHYVNFNDRSMINTLKDNGNLPFIKSDGFKSENEFRLNIEFYQKTINQDSLNQRISKTVRESFLRHMEPKRVISIELNDFEKYNFEIVFHPQMTDWVKNDIKKILNKFEIPFETMDSQLKFN
jgi:hypothetical protein